MNNSKPHKREHSGGFDKILSYVLGFLNIRYDFGSVTLVTSGSKSILIKTPFTPDSVWIFPTLPHSTPVCQGQPDGFDVRIVPNGFVLITNINTESRKVNWVAISSPNCEKPEKPEKPDKPGKPEKPEKPGKPGKR